MLYTNTNRWTAVQNFLDIKLLKAFFGSMVAYPFVFAANSKFVGSVTSAMSIVVCMSFLMVGYAFISWLFNRVDAYLIDQNGARTNHIDGLMSFVRTGAFVFFLFVLYRILLTGYLKVNVDTILPELYLLGHLPRTTFNYAHNTAVITNVAIIFPIVTAVVYSALAILRRSTR
ncbi:hypothetical protein [Pseudomonas orientalis]|uniref:Uncharacterized protein n=1 Tax=Pseudomonas orientalis TaxID=76758 RepID=A0A2L0RTM3_9PSED|nr:hypothetical protein [Pseudomonas orientalis]AUZ45350.1 hypothetical protein BOP93_06985 [Pseudomonas orientalis]